MKTVTAIQNSAVETIRTFGKASEVFEINMRSHVADFKSIGIKSDSKIRELLVQAAMVAGYSEGSSRTLISRHAENIGLEVDEARKGKAGRKVKLSDDELTDIANFLQKKFGKNWRAVVRLVALKVK